MKGLMSLWYIVGTVIAVLLILLVAPTLGKQFRGANDITDSVVDKIIKRCDVIANEINIDLKNTNSRVSHALFRNENQCREIVKDQYGPLVTEQGTPTYDYFASVESTRAEGYCCIYFQKGSGDDVSRKEEDKEKSSDEGSESNPEEPNSKPEEHTNPSNPEPQLHQYADAIVHDCDEVSVTVTVNGDGKTTKAVRAIMKKGDSTVDKEPDGTWETVGPSEIEKITVSSTAPGWLGGYDLDDLRPDFTVRVYRIGDVLLSVQEYEISGCSVSKKGPVVYT